MSLKVVLAFLLMAFASPVGAQTLQTLYPFTGGTDGANPNAALTLGNDGNFYGATTRGGSPGNGTLFRVTMNGTLTTLVSLSNGNGITSALTLGSDGNFYGTTEFGDGGHGTVFKLTTNGVLTSLASFNATNGEYPRAALTLGNDGNFYGTTYKGGSNGAGTVFKVTSNGDLTSVVSFNYTNGAYPETALTVGSDGNFYGTTDSGGINPYPGYGTIFRVTTNGTLTTLVSFNYGNGNTSALALGSDGNFYGTTWGSIYNNGTVYKVTTSGTFTPLVAFNYTNGANPSVALTLGSDGNFYGTTGQGGSNPYPGYGTLFQVTTNGTLTTLVSFNSTNGWYPYGALTLGSDANLYGTTYGGGSSDVGTVFRLLLPPVINVQPQSQTNPANGTTTFFVSATSLQSISYQWQKNGTNLVDGGNFSGTTTSILTITSISESDAANYTVIVSNANGSVTSSNAKLTVGHAPSIIAQPANLMVLPGTNVTFGVSLTGTAPFRYQWRFNGTNLLNATNAIYEISSVVPNKAGYYSVVVTNAAGSDTSSNAALAVVGSPKSRTNYASSTATFTATAFSPGSLNYQWQKNGTNIIDGGNLSGATNSTLTIANVSDADAAIYNAVVSDPYSSVATSNAVLMVNNFPFIATQPHSQSVVAGSVATFNVIAYGAPPFVFQWYFKGTPVGSPTAGTNFSSYTLANVGTNQAGNYSVRVVNGFSSVTSSNALLTVILPPRLALQLSAGYPLLNLYGILGSNFVVQYNTNLADTNWFLLLSLTNLSASPYQFLDPTGANQSARFYRAFMQ